MSMEDYFDKEPLSFEDWMDLEYPEDQDATGEALKWLFDRYEEYLYNVDVYYEGIFNEDEENDVENDHE